MSKIVFIDEKKNPYRYDIFTQLKNDGKAIIEDTDKNEWWRSESKQIGRIASNTKIDGKAAILHPASNQDHNVGYVLTNKGVVIKEDKKGRFIIDLMK